MKFREWWDVDYSCVRTNQELCPRLFLATAPLRSPAMKIQSGKKQSLWEACRVSD